MDTRAFDIGMIGQVMPDLLSYLDVTLLVGFVSIALGSLLGALITWAYLGGPAPLRWLVVGYVYVMRCTPSIVLLFIVFYGLPKLLDTMFGYDMNAMHRAIFAIITFTLLFGAYISEVFRAAYSAVPRGQYEAAVSAGLTPFQAFRHVMLGQTAIIALPNFGNAPGTSLSLAGEASGQRDESARGICRKARWNAAERRGRRWSWILTLCRRPSCLYGREQASRSR